MNYDKRDIRIINKEKNREIKQLIKQSIFEKNLQISLIKVKAYSGIKENELIDKKAKETTNNIKKNLIWHPISNDPKYGSCTRILWNGKPINSNIREFIKKSNEIYNNKE